MYHFCTYFDSRYLVRGLALYRSLARHANPFVLYVLCFDDLAHEVVSRLGLPNLQPISLEDSERGDRALLEAKRNRSQVEYYFTCTPSLPLFVLDHFPQVDVVTYLDADLYFYSDPAPIYEEMGGHSILMVEHRFPEHLRYLEKWGIYNVGLLAFRNDVHGNDCLRWWRERCLEWCYDRCEDGRFADQKYLDDWTARFPGVAVLKHKGAGLAPWNVAAYDIQQSNRGVLVDSDPLVFFHFHGLQVINGFLFDPVLDAYSVQLSRVLRMGVYRPYLRELRSAITQAGAGSATSFSRSYACGKPGLARLLAHRSLLLAAGPICSEVHLASVMRPLRGLRRLVKRHLMTAGTLS